MGQDSFRGILRVSEVFLGRLRGSLRWFGGIGRDFWSGLGGPWNEWFGLVGDPRLFGCP